MRVEGQKPTSHHSCVANHPNLSSCQVNSGANGGWYVKKKESYRYKVPQKCCQHYVLLSKSVSMVK